MSNPTELLLVIASTMLPHTPVYLVLAAGFVLAIVRWRQHPKVSRLAAIGLGTLLVVSVATTAVSATLPLYLRSAGISTSKMGVIFAAIAIVSSLLQAASWVGLLFAMFGWRSRSPVQP